VAKQYTKDVEAYQLYLTGRYHWSKLTPPEIKTSIGFFQQAIDKDPGYALAYFGLAEANRSLAINADVPSQDCLPQAKAAARRALELDDSLAEAHASLSFCLIWFDWDWAAAETEARRAIALNDNSAVAHFSYAHVLSDLGRHDEALSEIARARELEPVFLLACALEGMFLHHAGRDAEAKVKLEKALELDPDFWVTHLMLGRVLAQQKQYADAIDQLSKAKELSHGNSEAVGSIGYVLARQGKTAESRQVLEELMKRPNQPPYGIALVYAGLNEQDQALQWLAKGCDQRDVRVTLLKVDPRWEEIRAAPGFKALLQRIHLD
jgi:Flp pilus assembly protein TadD